MPNFHYLMVLPVLLAARGSVEEDLGVFLGNSPAINLMSSCLEKNLPVELWASQNWQPS